VEDEEKLSYHFDPLFLATLNLKYILSVFKKQMKKSHKGRLT